MKYILLAIIYFILISCISCNTKHKTNSMICGIDTCALYRDLERDTIVKWYDVPFHVIKKNLGDNLSNIEYMDSVFGKPVSIHEDTYRKGDITFSWRYESHRDNDVSICDYLDAVPECRIITYNWKVDSLRVLFINYLRDGDKYIPLFGYIYNIESWRSGY